MPSAEGLVFVAQLVTFVAIAYFISLRRLPRLRGIAAFFLFMYGTLGFYDGCVLAFREQARAQYGRVLSGVVVEKYRADGRGLTVASTGRQGPYIRQDGYLVSHTVAHWLAYGSRPAGFVDYRYPCTAGRNGSCLGRDRVTPELWSRLGVGDRVNVRQADTETVTARLDENPQRVLAAAQAAASFVFLLAGALVSGRLKLRRRTKYLQSEGVVTSVRMVTYGEEQRWKVTFAYFDQNGLAQESVDEVNQPTWKSGDSCIATYRPEIPDLATLQPLMRG